MATMPAITTDPSKRFTVWVDTPYRTVELCRTLARTEVGITTTDEGDMLRG